MQLVAVKPTIAAVLVALAVLSGCKQPPDLARSREQVLALTAQYAPQVKGLSVKCISLSGRVTALPANLPGATPLTATLARNQAAVATLQGLIDQLPGKTTAAIQTGKPAEVEALIARTIEEIGGGLLQLGDDVASAERAVVTLEATAREVPPVSTPPAPAPR